MSKKRKHKHRTRGRDIQGIDDQIKLYTERSIELCRQFESSTNEHTKRTIRAQYNAVCDIVNDLMNGKRTLT